MKTQKIFKGIGIFFMALFVFGIVSQLISVFQGNFNFAVIIIDVVLAVFALTFLYLGQRDG